MIFSKYSCDRIGESRGSNRMTVLVTGGAGYIGSHMVHELGRCWRARRGSRYLSTGFQWAVAPGVPLIVGETGDQALVARIFATTASKRSFTLPPRLWFRNRSRSARLLSQQYGPFPRADRVRGEERRT